jgi:TRAP-type C4-dicarboxylate transport system substrate-binding protein
MNKDKYESLPADLQKIIDDSMEFGKQEFAQTKRDGEKTGLEYMTGAGMEVIDLSAEEHQKWDTTVRPAFDAIAKDLDGRGFPGTELVNFALERAQFYLTN